MPCMCKISCYDSIGIKMRVKLNLHWIWIMMEKTVSEMVLVLLIAPLVVQVIHYTCTIRWCVSIVGDHCELHLILRRDISPSLQSPNLNCQSHWSHKSHNAPVPYDTMHHFVTEMCIVGYLSDALRDLYDGSMPWYFNNKSNFCTIL